ncbi:MAG: DMT family transporter [Pseudomonadota bacterium]
MDELKSWNDVPAAPQQNQTQSAVFAIVASVAALSLGDAVIKASNVSMPLWQIYILRSALAAPLLWWLALRHGPIAVSAPFWVVVRSVLLVLMWLAYYTSLPLMPLSLAAAAYYTGPLFIVALAALVAGRWPSGRAFFAIGCGFLGVLMVVRPDMSGFAAANVLPVVAAFLYACAMIVTSAKCSEDNPFALALALNLGFIIGGAGLGMFSGVEGSFILGPWQPVDLSMLSTTALLAGLLTVGSVGAAIAYQTGPPVTVASFDYSYLVFSLIWGAAFFAEIPGAVALFGIAAIIAGGLLALSQSGDGDGR